MSTAPAPSPRRSEGFLWWAPIASILAAVFAATVVVVFLSGISSLKGSQDGELSATGTLVATYAQDFFMVACAVAFAKLSISHVTPATFGIRRIRLSRQLWIVPVTFIAFWAVLQIFGHLVDSDAKDDLPGELGAKDATGALIAVTVLVCTVAPLVEETVFRGFLYKAFERAWGWVPAAIVSGLVFGGVHAAGTPAVFLLPLSVFGFVLCLVYRRTGSLLPGMGMHALNNGIALGSALDWSVGGTVAAAVLAPLSAISIGWLVARE